MSKKLADLAKELDCHPSELLRILGQVGENPASCWPDISDEWVETVSQMVKPGLPSKADHAPQNKVKTCIEPATAEIPVSTAAARVLDKLFRKDMWNLNYASPSSVAKMAKLSLGEYKEVARELLKMDLILVKPHKGNSISLNPHKNKEIDAILKAFDPELIDNAE